jgi:hypothetical protein
MELIDGVKKISACIKEYHKQVRETADDIDAAYYFDKCLKRWIKNNMDVIDILSTHGLDKGFVKFVKHYLIVDKEEE